MTQELPFVQGVYTYEHQERSRAFFPYARDYTYPQIHQFRVEIG